jgi:CRISPR-associated endonuclease/helicase Cas3
VREKPERGVAKREGFRHELVSVFMLSTPMATDLLDRLDVPRRWHPLVRYLVAAHHGYLRVSARDNRWDGRDGRGIFGCFDGESTPALGLGEGELPASSIDLGIFDVGRSDSWTEQVLDILEEIGPFRLAYLEALVRMADWRASGGLGLAGGMP